MSSFTALLIDPKAGTITPVEYDGDYRTIYKLIGCETFDAARMDDTTDVVFVDDEGLLRHNDPDNFFLPRDRDEPLAGKGLILGTDSNGESVAPKMNIVEALSRFLRCELLAGGAVIALSEFRAG